MINKVNEITFFQNEMQFRDIGTEVTCVEIHKQHI